MFNITSVGQDLDTCIGDTGGADTFVSYRARQKKLSRVSRIGIADNDDTNPSIIIQ